MKTKTFRFQTGVSITVGAEQITARDESGADKMDSKHVDSLSYEEFVQPRIPPAGLATIPFVLGFFILIISGGDGTPLFYLGATLLGLSVVGFIFVALDALLFTGVARKLIASVWAHKGYAIEVGNKQGNNISFFALDNELERIKQVSKMIDELKVHLSQLEEQKVTPVIQQSSSYLDELKKLGELLNTKVITQSEFDIKKAELLK